MKQPQKKVILSIGNQIFLKEGNFDFCTIQKNYDSLLQNMWNIEFWIMLNQKYCGILGFKSGQTMKCNFSDS